MRRAIWRHVFGHTDSLTHYHTHSHTQSIPHTIKPPTAGVKLVGHTSKITRSNCEVPVHNLNWKYCEHVYSQWLHIGVKHGYDLVRELYTKIINAFEIKCQRKIVLAPWIVQRTNYIYQWTGCILLLLLLPCPSHTFLSLAGACLCPLSHCGQVVSRAGLV